MRDAMPYHSIDRNVAYPTNLVTNRGSFTMTQGEGQTVNYGIVPARPAGTKH